MPSIAKDKNIDNVLCLLHKYGLDVSTIIRKNAVEDDSALGFHIVNRYEVTVWEKSPIYELHHCRKNSNSKYLKEVGNNNIPTTTSFFSKTKYALYLIELLKERQQASQ